MDTKSRILIAAGENFAAEKLEHFLRKKGFRFVFTDKKEGADLACQKQLGRIFSKSNPEYVFLFPVRSGGIAANIRYPADFCYYNTQALAGVIHHSYKMGVRKLLFLASSCVYPKHCPQPMREEYLLSGAPESTNEAYSIANIAAIKMCQAYNKQYKTRFISAIPATVYGPGSHFDLENSHVISALIRKFHEAKAKVLPEVLVWGTGKARREFIHIDDLMRACLVLMGGYSGPDLINIGSGKDVSIAYLAMCIKEVSGFSGKVYFDRTKPEGTQRKLLDSRKIKKTGWKNRVTLLEGIRQTYRWYSRNEEK
ncbi:MAG: GDP-L-fucose synthase [Candidatus Omnitrophica bacterium]|nr:GDP-L-fucose synthase [Candidatus Omnitrophota bacterium]